MTRDKKEESSLPMVKRLLGYVFRHWGMFALGVAGLAAAGATNTGFLAALKTITDDGFVRKDQAVLGWLPWLLFTLGMMRATSSFVANYAMRWVSRRVVADLRLDCFSKLIAMPVSFFDHHSAGTLTSKITYDCEQMASVSSKALVSMVEDTVTVVGGVGYMLYLDWRLTAAFIVFSPLVVGYMRRTTPRLRRMSKRAQQAIGGVTQVAEEAFSGQRMVKIYHGEPYELERMEEAVRTEEKMKVKAGRLSSMNMAVMEMLAVASLSGIIAYSLKGFTAGEFTTFLAATLMILSPIKSLTGVNELLQRTFAAAQSVFSAIDATPEEDTGKISLHRVQGRVEFKEVRFRYPGPSLPALDGINFLVEPGTKVAIVGRSGSGKTTLLSLLPRFYNLEEGQILLDGHDIREYTLHDLRAQMALVSQEVILFNDTVARNVAYGANRRCNRDEIKAACLAAHAWEFIETLPQGLDTMIGDRGVRLSGGQRQRLAIARAILKDAPILLLDEATSNLDSESERHVQDALKILMKDKTSIVVAHRLSTISNSDMIVVMEKGKIVEMGTHAGLLAQAGAYARLYEMQAIHEKVAP